MEFPEIADFPRAGLTPGDGPFAVLARERDQEARLLALAEQYGPRLLVSEVWSRVLPRCGVLISSAISGGTFSQRVEEAARAYPRRCWLLLEPLSMEFPLPCPTGVGKEIPITNDGKSFYSEALCCQYTHFVQNQQGRMVLWDTADTLGRKLELARAAGFLGYVWPT